MCYFRSDILYMVQENALNLIKMQDVYLVVPDLV